MTLVTTLLYRGSRDGWTYNEFYKLCRDKSLTISLFKIKDGDCIGGLRYAKWSSDSKETGPDDGMLFNLSCSRFFPK
jgi:hypothetical protein